MSEVKEVVVVVTEATFNEVDDSIFVEIISSLGIINACALTVEGYNNTGLIWTKTDGTTVGYNYTYKTTAVNSALGYVTTSDNVPLIGGQITSIQKINEIEYYNYSLPPADQKVGYVEYNPLDNTLTDESIPSFPFFAFLQSVGHLNYSLTKETDFSALVPLCVDELVAQSE